MRRPDITTPHALFEASARYKAPVFQRYYVWGKKEFISLVEDIDTADAEIGQFLGAIVLKDLGRQTGPTSPSTYLLIDGQQRLTTLYLFLLGLAKVAHEQGEKADALFIWQNYLVETKSPQFEGWPKLVPTLQDRHTFYTIMASALPEFVWNVSEDPEDKKPRVARRVQYQWDRICRHLDEVTGVGAGSFDKAVFNSILDAVQTRLKVIVITLDSVDDANATFSRLNAKGVPLELADLVRNEVFSKFGPAESAKADKYYAKSWQPFEKSLPEGSLSAFFPIYAYIALRGKVTKAAAFAELQKVWRTKNPGTVLSDLQTYSPYFASLTSYKAVGGLSKDVNAQVERFSRMPRTRVTWPFMIQVLRAVHDKALGESDALKSLRFVESFLVRRALVGREPTGLHAVFKTLWDKTKGKPRDVKSHIVTRTIKSPTDDELRAFLEKERSDTRVMLKYILAEHEREFIKSNKYDPLTQTVATIEHILPKNLAEHWAKSFTPMQHEKLVGLLGNLAPLSEMQNKSLQDQAWAEKRKRFNGSDFKSTRVLAKVREWSPQQLERRNSELIAWVINTWPEL